MLHRSIGSILVSVLASTLLACSGSGGPTHEKPELGSMHVALQVAPGISLASLSYDVMGNGFSKSGTLDVSGSTTVSARIDGIPAGNGYLLGVGGTLAGNGGSCSASATFDVKRGQTTMVSLALRCRPSPEKGAIVINGQINVCPRIDAVDVAPAEAMVGHAIALAGSAVDPDGLPSPLTHAWSTTLGSLGDAALPSTTLTCTSAGTGKVTWTVSDGDCSDAVTVTVVCTTGAPPPPAVVRLNEVESSGGQPGDWVELFNAGSAAADLSGYSIKDNDDTHVLTIAAGTVLAPGAFLALGEPEMSFGLGSGDSVRLFDAAGALVDSYTWTAHAGTTYGRCPDGTGSFVTTVAGTRAAVNACASEPADGGAPADASTPDGSAPVEAGPVDGGAAPVVVEAWPGGETVAEADVLNQFGDNLSGLTYEPGGVLWAVLNSPSVVYRMVRAGAVWTFDPNGWAAGKAIRYPSGTGNPDSEGITKAEWNEPYVYVSSERNNDASSISRLAILRFDTSAPGDSLTATHEWNLTADLPATGANLGLEAITWVPDAFLVARGFIDQSTGAPYVPSSYPGHGTGLFLVGVEGSGKIYAYALDHGSSAFHRVATIDSGHPAVMALELDRETGALWAHCDNTCGNVSNILGISAGKLVVQRAFARPAALPDSNNEGLALGPESECVAGRKPIFWSDDSHFAGHALREGTVPCGPLF